VNRAKLKFTKLITTTSRVSVRNIIESERGRKNKSQANKEVRHKDLFYRGSVLANLLPVEEATKARSFSTLFPLSNGPSDRVSYFFSNTWNTKFPQGPPHNWCLLPQLQVSLISRKIEKEKKQSKRKSSKEHNKSLSLVTKALCGIWERI
jgi:hypothetical protein